MAVKDLDAHWKGKAVLTKERESPLEARATQNLQQVSLIQDPIGGMKSEMESGRGKGWWYWLGIVRSEYQKKK